MNSETPRIATPEEIPVLDLSSLIRGENVDFLATQFRVACETIGFFYVSNHGVPQIVIDNLFEAMRRYFSLSMDIRETHLRDEKNRRGYVPFGNTRRRGNEADFKESFDFGLELATDHPSVIAGLPMHGSNFWPDEYPWLRSAAEGYATCTLNLGKQLLQLAAVSLGLDAGYFSNFHNQPMVQTRLLHYPPQHERSDDLWGARPHTDFGMLTMLSQDPIGGLEVMKRDGEWVGAPFIDGTLVINLGNLFNVWTNDVYVSNPHRVVNRTGKERFSVPTFFNLDYETVAACVPTCVSETRPARYSPTICGEYLIAQFREAQGYRG